MKSKYNSLSSSLLGLSRLLVGGFCAGALAFAPCAWADSQSFNTVGTSDWAVPANVNFVTVECRGGGGSGGSINSQAGSSGNIRGGGGAGGNYARKVNIPVSFGQTYKVTVGASGVHAITGFAHNESLTSQIGGSSSFRTSDLATTHVLATGGLGGKNGLRIGVATGGASNATSTAASSTGSVGDTIILGGNGGGAGSTGTGCGGGGAGNTSPGGNGGTGPSAAGAAGVSGGGIGANGATDLSIANGSGKPGTAPGGGGSGAQQNSTHISFVNGAGGAGGAGSVLLTWTVDAGTTKYVVTSANSSQAVGAIFDVTITAKNNSDVTVTADTNVITMSSPTSGSLMEFDFDGNGTTFGDNSGTLVNGTRTIKARNKKGQTADIVASAGPVTTPIPLSIKTTLGAFSKLQILVPGETAAPGTATGKTGTPSGYAVGSTFNATVNAVDEFWNFINTVTDTVAITSTDGLATLPASTPLALGTVSLPVTVRTPGQQTVTASNGIFSSTSANITIFATGRTWTGINSNLWDTTSENWTAGDLKFADLYSVTFGSASVTSVDVNAGTVAPFSMLVNSGTLDYEIINGTITGMAGGLTKAQAGSLTFNTTNTYTGPTTVNGGLLRLKSATALPATSALTINTGILGLEGSDFTRPSGAAAGQVVLTGAGGGFAAFGVNRFVNLGGAGAQLTWGTGGFFDSSTGNMTLGHIAADATVDFQNPINIAGTNRQITVPDGSAAIDAIISGAITNSGAATNLAKSGDGTLMLSGVNAWGNELRINQGTVMLGGSTGMVIGDTSNVQLGAGGTSGTVTFDVNGRAETILNLNLGGQNTTTAPGSAGNQHAVINSGVAAVLTINGLNYFTPSDPLALQNGQATVSAALNTGAGNKNFNINNSVYDAGSGPLAEEVIVSGALTGTSITKGLTGTLVLTNPLYSGNTTVSAGTLIIRKTGSQTNANPNNDTSTVTIATGAVLNLDYTGTDTVAGLVIGAGSPVAPGVYGSADFPGVITGTGKITVITDPFLTWTGNNPAVLFDGDTNSDGVKNGLAWLLGAANPTVNANGLLPIVSQTGGSLKMTFKMLPAAARGGAKLSVQHSSDLGIMDPWSTAVLVPDATGGTAPVTFTVSGTNPLDVVIDISSTEAAGGKLFGRLRADR